MPSECPHGFVYDWGDFGCQEEECYGTCELSPPEPCTEGCGSVPTDLVLTDAADALLALAGALKASQDENAELVRQLESARRWAVHLEGENSALLAAAAPCGAEAPSLIHGVPLPDCNRKTRHAGWHVNEDGMRWKCGADILPTWSV